MHAQIDELFEFGGVLLALIRVAAPLCGDPALCCRLEQDGAVLLVPRHSWAEIPSAASGLEQNQDGPGRRVIPVRRMRAYLVAFADEARRQFSATNPVIVTVQATSAALNERALSISGLAIARLDDPVLKEALRAAVQTAGVPAVAAALDKTIKVEALERFNEVQVTGTILANAGLVLTGRIKGAVRPNMHIVSADLRSWVPPFLIAYHARSHDGAKPGASPEGVAQHPDGPDFTAVLSATAGQVAREVYFVEADPAGDATVFYGPLTVNGVNDEQQAFRRVKEAFGPIQSLPRALVQHVYRPILARPKTSARARRFTFGPPIDEAEPLVSIIIPFYGDAFFLNCASHLQRLLGPGFEMILVVDDPRIWPRVYGQLSARRSSIVVPTVLLECEDNYGYARANNLGAMAARGDVLVLMNSDIMVVDVAALNQAAAAIRGRRQAREPEAIIGFSLLFEDDTIQHVGMEFPRSPLVGDMRLADHPLKGLPSALLEGDEGRRVPAVTGALMALSSDLYGTLGGFDAAYERGDFEDADLCLRAQQSGAEIWVHVAPGLYHLERQSIRAMGDAHLREAVTYLNCLTFNARWDAHLSEPSATHIRVPASQAAGRRPITVRKRHSLQAALHHPASQARVD
ncbi:glycosyltransferase family 2 protein [Microvirga soli]|uniref:glycosyltransferase family 2 protein n=1 Tax=Microvirga soli TaxID=1854496 RepID=UPI00191E57D0|nr:hypothetical protein [Microvirga soli]